MYAHLLICQHVRSLAQSAGAEKYTNRISEIWQIYDSKQSDDKVPSLELWGIWSAPSLPSSVSTYVHWPSRLEQKNTPTAYQKYDKYMTLNNLMTRFPSLELWGIWSVPSLPSSVSTYVSLAQSGWSRKNTPTAYQKIMTKYMTLKQSDDKVPSLELWGIWSAPSLPSSVSTYVHWPSRLEQKNIHQPHIRNMTNIWL